MEAVKAHETIYFVSDFVFFSAAKDSGKYKNVLEALTAHIEYLREKSQAYFNLNKNKWLKLANQEIQKRKKSRVALKFFIAIPRNFSNIRHLHKKLKAFLSKELQVPHKFIAMAFVINAHNPHVHVLIFPRKYDGKKLSLNKYALKRFHRNFKKFWKKIGYKIKLRKIEQKLPHLGKAIKEIPPDISRKGILLAKIKPGTKVRTKLLCKLEKHNNSEFFLIYWVMKTNTKYKSTHFWYNKPKNLINNLLRKVLNSQIIHELWIISDKEKTDFLIFLKIKKRGGKENERNHNHI